MSEVNSLGPLMRKFTFRDYGLWFGSILGSMAYGYIVGKPRQLKVHSMWLCSGIGFIGGYLLALRKVAEREGLVNGNKSNQTNSPRL